MRWSIRREHWVWISPGPISLWGFIDLAGRFIVEPQFSGFTNFSEGLAGFSIDHRNQYKTGFIDSSGKVVIELVGVNAEVEGVGFRNGLAAVWVRSPGIWSIIDGIFDETGRGRKFWGFIDRSGRQVIPLKYDAAGDFSECLASVESGGKWGFINTTGQMVVKPQFENPPKFSEGLASVEFNQKYGYINKTGKMVISPQFYSATIFSEGLATVQMNKGGKWGFIDRTGKMVISPQFDDTKLFDKGLAGVKVGDKWGYIKRTGTFVWHPTS